MPPKKKVRTEKYLKEMKQRRAEKQRLRRQTMTEEKKAEIKKKDAERERRRVANMTEAERNQLREKNAVAQKRRRVNKNEEELAFERLMQDDDLNLLETDASCQSESNQTADNQQTIQLEKLNKSIDVPETATSSQSAISSEINQSTPNESASMPAIPVEVSPSQPSVNSHECPHCPEKQIFQFRSGLDRHLMLMHKNEMDNSCQTCGSKYNNEFAAHQHHMSKKCLSEPFAPVVIPIVTIEEIPISIKQEAPTCSHCIKIFAFRSQLDRHLVKKHSDQIDNLCERCGLKYANHFAEHEHHLSKRCPDRQRKVTPKLIKIPAMKKAACEICRKFYNTEQGMRYHLRITHGIVTPQLNCTTCGFNASTAEDLLEHKQTSHETLSCQCGNTSACLLTYYRHIRSCPGFEQTVRSNATKNDSQVKAANENNIECTKCIQKFGSVGERKIHIQTHGSNASCNLCRGVFKTSNGLNVHKKEAHGISSQKDSSGPAKRTYYCSVCNKGFSTSVDVKNHQMSAHPNYIPLQKTAPTTSSLLVINVIKTWNHNSDANTLSFSDGAAKPNAQTPNQIEERFDSHAQQIDYDDDEQEEVEEEFTPLECQVCSTIFLNALDLKNHEAEEHHNNSEEDCPIKSEIKLEVSESEEEDMISLPEFPVPMQLQLEGDEVFDSFAIIPTSEDVTL